MSELTNRRNSTAGIAGTVTLVLALAFVAIFVIIPGIYSFIMSFKDYNYMHGLFGSPWVGLENYANIFQSDQFWASAIWTVRYSAISAAALFVLSLGIGMLINAIQVKWLRHALCTVLLLPLVVPGELWATGFLGIFTVKGTTSIWLLPVWNALKYTGLPALLVAASLSHGRRSLAVPLLSAGAAALALFALLGRTDYTLLKALSNPLNNIQLLDDFIYRRGLLQMDMGTAVISQITVSVMRCVLIAAVAWPMAAMLRRLFPPAANAAPALPRDRFISLAVAGAVALAALTALGAVTVTYGSGGGTSNQEAVLYQNSMLYMLLALVSSFINTVICFLLARTAACGGKVGKPVMIAVLVLLTSLSSAAYSIGEYLIFHSLGMMNTVFAVALSGIGAVWGVWPLLFAAQGMGISTNEEWFRRMWRPALALFAIQAAILANNTVPSQLYSSSDVHLLHPLIGIQRIASAGQFGIDATISIGLIMAITMLVPVALLLTVRTAFNEKDNLALFLPGK